MTHEPMLATAMEPGQLGRYTLADGWTFEPKIDGIRVLARKSLTGRVRLSTRTGRDVSEQFPEVVQALAASDWSFVLDGELQLIAQEGGDARLPNLLARLNRTPRSFVGVLPARFWAFDVLSADGVDQVGRTLSLRRLQLEGMLSDLEPSPHVHLVPWHGRIGARRDLVETVRAHGGEGIVAKRENSPYVPGRRSAHWLKHKFRFTLTCIALGTTATDSATRPFGALELALLEDTRPVHIGTVGSGLTAAAMKVLAGELADGKFPLVQVSVMGRTRTGLREPVFEGLVPGEDFDSATIDQLDDVPLNA